MYYMKKEYKIENYSKNQFEINEENKKNGEKTKKILK